MIAIRFILFSAILLAAVAYILYYLLSFLMGTSSVARQLRRDLKMLKRQLNDFKEGLIPFDMDEYKIASSSPILKNKRRGRTVILKGFLSTIYQEPIMAFALKDQLSNDQFVLISESDKDEFVFIYKPDGIMVKHNGRDLGMIDDHDRLVDQNGKILGQLDLNESQLYQKIVVGDKDVAHMNVYENGSRNESDRMFSLFHEFSPSDEEEMIALSLYNLLIRPRLDKY